MKFLNTIIQSLNLKKYSQFDSTGLESNMIVKKRDPSSDVCHQPI